MNIKQLSLFKKTVLDGSLEICKGKATPSQIYELANKALEEALTIPVVVSSFITADDEGKYFIVNTNQLDEIEKGSVVYLLKTYPEDIHLFIDKNDDEVWLDADDVDRKQ